MKYIFLDTNIFIHFQYFENIDWQEIINDSNFTIVLTPTVLDELDNHKYNQNKKVAKRVKTLLPKIEKIIENPTLCKIKFQYITSRPDDDLFTNHGLNKDKQDDWLLASMLNFAIENEIQNIFYISYDTAPRLKAKTFNIFATKLPEKYLLVDELDETEKKNTQLQKEITELKNQIPKMKFSFIDNSDLLVVKLPEMGITEETYITNELDKIRKQYQYLSREKDENLNPYNNPILLMGHNPFLKLSEYQVTEYNKSLDKYFNQCSDYFQSKYNQYSFLEKCIIIKLKLSNDGTSPAKVIELNLHFPDGFELCDKRGIPKIKDKPEPPYKPKNGLDMNITPLNHSMLNIFPSPKITTIKNTYPIIKKTSNYLGSF